MSTLRLSGLTVINAGEPPVEEAAITVQAPYITDMTRAPGRESGAPNRHREAVIDLTGRFCIPGLVDAHMHLQLDGGTDPLRTLLEGRPADTTKHALARAQSALRAGITAVRDCGARDNQIIDLRDSIDAGEVPGPHIAACGRPLTVHGGHMSGMGRAAHGTQEFRIAAREQMEAGADFVKIMATGGVATRGAAADTPQVSTEELSAVVEEAHASGRPVAAHAYGSDGIRRALDAGVDAIEHCTHVDDELAQMVAQAGTSVVPTLMNTYSQSVTGREVLGREIVRAAENVHRSAVGAVTLLRSAGVPLACGTDGGAWLNPHDDVVTELELRVALGVTTADALRMATVDAATVAGLDDIGRIEPGRRADLVVLSASPLDDIRNLRSVELVIKDGRIVEDRRRSAAWPPGG